MSFDSGKKVQTLFVEPRGGQFSSVAAAIAAADSPSDTNRYVVQVGPGTYLESPFTMRPYVDVVALGTPYDTILEALDNNNHFITGDHDAILTGFGIRGPTGVGEACLYNNSVSAATEVPFYVIGCTFLRGYYGLWTHHDTVPVYTNIDDGVVIYEGANMDTFLLTTGFGNLVALDPYVQGPLNSVDHACRVIGANARCLIQGPFFEAPGATDLTYVDEGAQLRVIGGTFVSGDIAIHIGPSGASTLVNCVGVAILNGGFTTDILVDSATAQMRFSGGSADKTKISIAPGAVFAAQFADRTVGEEGTVVDGELWVGTEVESVPLGSLTRDTAATGLISGGNLTVTGGLNISVASGEGYINTGTGVVRAIWATAPLALTASVLNYIYINSAGVVSKALAPPSETNNIRLGGAFCDGASVVWISEQSPIISFLPTNLRQWIRETQGNLWVSGITTSIVAAPSVNLYTSGGVNYQSNTRTTYAASASPAVFTSWYFNGASWATSVGLTNVDVANYSSGGALVPIPLGKHVKHGWYASATSASTAYHMVYATEFYDTQVAAEAAALPSPPSFFGTGAVRVAGIVCSEGLATIASTTDERLRSTSAAATSGGAAGDHNLLINNDVDNHPQYALLSGNAARNPVTGEVDFTGGSLTVPVAAIPVQTKQGAMVWDSTNDWLTVGDGVARKTLLQNGVAAGGDVGGTFPTGLTVIDLTMAGEVQGAILYFNGVNWVVLPPGVAGRHLETQGPGANPAWAIVTSVVGPAGATNDALARYDGVTGYILKNSTWLLSDAGLMDGSTGSLILPQGIAPLPIASGRIAFNTTDLVVQVGTGAVTKTLVDTNTNQTLSLKTLTSPALNTSLVLNQASFNYTLSWTDPAAARALTIPDPLGDDTFVFVNAAQTLASKTLTTPTIASFVNAGHTHQNAAGGAQLDHGLAMTGASLLDDDHTQYALLSGNAVRNAVLGEFDFTAGILTFPAVLVPAQTKEGSAVWNTTTDHLTVGDGASRKTLMNEGDAAGGDVGGTFPTSLTVTDLTIAGEAHGDLLYRNATNWVRLAPGTPGYVLATQGVGVAPSWTSAGIASVDYASYREQQPSGTAGGTFTAGAWQTRNLNTTVTVSGADITRAGAVITLQPGTYKIEAIAVAYRVAGNKVRFRNTTDGTTALVGTNAYAQNAPGASDVVSEVSGIVTVAAPKNFELQHWGNTTRATDGFGLAVTSGEVEVYSKLFVQRIA